MKTNNLVPKYDFKADLEKLKRSKMPLRTSDGTMFCGPNDWWTRDAAISASDFMQADPLYSESVVSFLASKQGVSFNKYSGEEPGRMPTEHREIFYNDKLSLLNKIGLSIVSGFLWKIGFKQYDTYYSYDTTPLFIKAVCEYAKIDPKILDKQILNKNNAPETIRQTVINGAKYIESTISSDGLIRLKNHNLFGDLFRYWRDHPNSYFADNGALPNIISQMVVLDIQALSAEALDNAASVCNSHKLAKKWHKLATKIRSATIDNLWMENEQYFAYGMHQNKNGRLEKLKTIQSNAGWLLNTNFFDGFSVSDRRKYITGIVNRLFSDELLTDVGIRCRSKNTMFYRKVQDYHGSWVSWPMESYMIAKGLRRQGLHKLADQIESRIVNSVKVCGVAYEFFVIDNENNVLYEPQKHKRQGDKPLYIEMKPENSMAWTLSALSRIDYERKHNIHSKSNRKQQVWLSKLEKNILDNITIFPVNPTTKQTEDYIKQCKEPKLYISQTIATYGGGLRLLKDIALSFKK